MALGSLGKQPAGTLAAALAGVGAALAHQIGRIFQDCIYGESGGDFFLFDYRAFSRRSVCSRKAPWTGTSCCSVPPPTKPGANHASVPTSHQPASRSAAAIVQEAWPVPADYWIICVTLILNRPAGLALGQRAAAMGDKACSHRRQEEKQSLSLWACHNVTDSSAPRGSRPLKKNWRPRLRHFLQAARTSNIALVRRADPVRAHRRSCQMSIS